MTDSRSKDPGSVERSPLVSRYGAVIIAGPTAVGKSDFAVEAALQAGGEIVGADAFQVYRGLEVLTAQPSVEQCAAVPHFLVGEVPLTASFDVAQYLGLAERWMAEIRARGKIPFVVGGTGLYIRALIRGMADLPPADPQLRASLEAQPLAELQRKLAELDPAASANLDLKNPRRVIRALEVCILTGRPFSSFGEEWKAAPSAECGVLLLRDREELNVRIDRRVEEMFAAGAVEEVERAGENISPTARQTLGWREIRRRLAGELTHAECVASIQQATRQYAKRQFTWFRKETGLRPVELGSLRNALHFAAEFGRSRRRTDAPES